MINIRQADPTILKGKLPVMSMTEAIFNSIEKSYKSGAKVELVPFSKWQSQRNASLTVKTSERKAAF